MQFCFFIRLEAILNSQEYKILFLSNNNSLISKGIVYTLYNELFSIQF
jgi:hypothetical protein